MEYIVKILKIEPVTHDVKRFEVEKPDGFKFTPGNATSVSINTEEFKNNKRPFTFTSQNKDPNLEFIIKGYPDHHGVTEKLHTLKPGDELIIEDPWGTIQFENSGIFIAGGAGITPFIAILRYLKSQGRVSGNKLFFSNKTPNDIILEEELKEILPRENLILTTTKEKSPNYHFGRIDKPFLEKNIDDFDQNFYICGPKQMVEDIKKSLMELGANPQEVVFEK